MKLATRMAVCLTLLAGLLIGTSLYQLRQIERIHSIGRELGATDVEAGRISLQLLQSIGGVNEFAQKALLVGDSSYFSALPRWELDVERNVVTVRAQRPVMDNSREMLASERPRGVFSRQLVLGDSLDTEHIAASYEAGVLTLRIPVAEQAKPRKIAINAQRTADRQAINA